MKNYVTIATFNDAAKAEPLKQRLEQAGIPALVQDDSMLERVWFVKEKLANVRVKVESRDYERALELLRQWDVDGALRDAVRCPECKSPRVEYPQFTRKFFLPNLVGLFASLGGTPKEFYCQDCHFTWPKEGKKLSVTRPNMAPYYFIDGIEQTHLQQKPVAEDQRRAGSLAA